MTETKAYFLGYRRAVYLDGAGQRTLEADICEAHSGRNRVEERRVQLGVEDTLECRHLRALDKRGLLMHLVAFSRGSRANVVPHHRTEGDAPIDTAPPPEGTDFLDGNLAVCVRGNHIVFCGRSMRETGLRRYTCAMTAEAGLPKEAQQFDLQKIADVNKLNVIREEGVRAVSLQSSIYAATLRHADRRHRRGGLPGFVSDLAAIFEREERPSALEAENLHARVELRFKKRGGGEIAQATIRELAEEMVEDRENGFVIETLKNNRITHEEVLVRKRVSLRQFGKSFDYEHAWTELLTFLDELRAEGILEQ